MSMQALVNGSRVAYTDEGSGQALLFVHGFPLNRTCWSRQVAAFKSRYRVIVPDLSGFGDSGSNPGPASMQEYAESLFQLCQQLRTGPVVLVGHSMGGYIALAFANHYPLFLRGLVLVGTRAGGDEPEVAAARLVTIQDVLHSGIGPVVVAMGAQMLSDSNPDTDEAHAVQDMMWTSSLNGVIGALLGMIHRPDEREHVPFLHIPTLVMTGADDKLISPLESVDLAHAIPGAKLVVIPHAGHLVAYEQSVLFNEALRKWLLSAPSDHWTQIRVHEQSRRPNSFEGVPS